MATISSEQDQSAQIVIPAADLEDARKALSVEIALDAEHVAEDHGVERDGSVKILQRDISLQQQIISASSTVTVTAERDHVSSPIEHMLDEIIRIVAKRLDVAGVYAPVPMGTILDIADELRWAATEAIRIEPSLDQREDA
jgi:hypothetical protein